MDAGDPATASIDLSGTWRAAASDEDRRAWARASAPGEAPAADADAWVDLAVPSHWRSHDAFADHDGPVLVHRDLASPAAPFGPGAGADGEAGEARRTFLVAEGVFATSDWWLDGTYLGDTEGYFFPHAFEVTDLLGAGNGHRLVAEVACPPQRDRTRKRSLTGTFQHGLLVDPAWNPGGIWRPVRLHQSGPVRMRHHRLVVRDCTEASATLTLRAVLDTAEARSVTLVVDVAGTRHCHPRALAAGENRVEWTVTVPEPERWWPHALGPQPLHDVRTSVELADGSTSDVVVRRTGFRSVEMTDFVLAVNGERLFLKGTCLAPTRQALGEATAAEIRADVAAARDLGFDLVRVHAHVSRPELSAAADELGVLVWQDLPLQWGYARTVRPQARRQAREAVDLLAHHPSLVVWCAHDEPAALDVGPDTLAEPAGRARLRRQRRRATALPSWNRSVLDLAVRRVLVHCDGSRPVVAHSGVPPHLPQLSGTDSHLFLGWRTGSVGDLAELARRWPRRVRFVGELGAASVPSTDAFCEPARWPDLDTDRLVAHHGFEPWWFDERVPAADHDSFAAWRDATQAHQALVVRRQIEELRRLKYRPTGGFAQFVLADAHPAVSYSLLDHERRPKAAAAAVAAANAPVIVVADALPARCTPGDALALDVHVVSDLRHDLVDLEVMATLGWGDQQHTWRWRGDAPADSCVRVGTLRFVVPDVAGVLALDLELTGSGPDGSPMQATNGDRSVVGTGRAADS